MEILKVRSRSTSAFIDLKCKIMYKNCTKNMHNSKKLCLMSKRGMGIQVKITKI